jgi:hypothetical protein
MIVAGYNVVHLSGPVAATGAVPFQGLASTATAIKYRLAE